jgi:hypothetical protein
MSVDQRVSDPSHKPELRGAAGKENCKSESLPDWHRA